MILGHVTMTRRSCCTRPRYSVLSFYHLKPLDSPEEVKSEVESFLTLNEAKGRFYLNRKGMNASVCVPQDREACVGEFLASLLSVPLASLRLARHQVDFPVFQRLRIRHGKLLEGMQEDFDPETAGRHVDSDEWNRTIRENPAALILDVRNGYEWDVGRFQGAERPQVTQFKDFPSAVADRLEKDHDPAVTPVLMYCTGGIRCELFSSLLVSRGWENVQQLDGGVLGYSGGRDTGEWRGNLFVFDDRLVVPIDGVVGGEKDSPVGRCVHCGAVAEMCFNCNHLTCNEVFVSCVSCAHSHRCCCSSECFSTTEKHFIARNRLQVKQEKLGGQMTGRGRHYRDWVQLEKQAGGS